MNISILSICNFCMYLQVFSRKGCQFSIVLILYISYDLPVRRTETATALQNTDLFLCQFHLFFSRLIWKSVSFICIICTFF